MSTSEAVIVGAAETERVGKVPDKSMLGLHLEAAHRALSDSGLSIRDIDGLATVGSPGPVEVAHALGIKPSWHDGTNLGGTSFLLHVRHAVAAIATNQCSTVLITHGQSGHSRIAQPQSPSLPGSLAGHFELPYGITGPPTRFTLTALRYMADYGVTDEQLAMVPVVQREWARRNSHALFRDPITVDDVLSSRMIAYPFRLLQCCLVTDGGGALIITSADKASATGTPNPPVQILGAGEASEAPLIATMRDFTFSEAFASAGRHAMAQAGTTTADIDHLMIYDAFAHVPLYGLEALGFAGRGEAADFIAEGHTRPGRTLPMNTNGGGLSYTHTGMYGMFAILESVRQLRGEADAQVPGTRTSLVLGNGGSFTTAGVLVLAATN